MDAFHNPTVASSGNVFQLQTYVFLVPSAQFDQQSDTLRGSRNRRRIRWIFGGSYTDTFTPYTDDEPGESGEPTQYNNIIDSVRELNFAEKKSIMQIPAASDEEDLKLFARYCDDGNSDGGGWR